MYLYGLCDWNSDKVLAHPYNFCQEEFEEICNKAPKDIDVDDEERFNSVELVRYLIEEYRFSEIEYQASLFIG